jgi:uncharacterized membrane protein YfcA
MLTLLFGVDIRYAAGAALISVIATSSGAASAYVPTVQQPAGRHFLEVATTFGAVVGASLAAYISGSNIAVIFGVVLLRRPRSRFASGKTLLGLIRPIRSPRAYRLDSSYRPPSGPQAYHVHGVPPAFGMMFLAGALSGCSASDRAQSRCWRSTGPCAFPSRSRPPPATS